MVLHRPKTPNPDLMSASKGASIFISVILGPLAYELSLAAAVVCCTHVALTERTASMRHLVRGRRPAELGLDVRHGPGTTAGLIALCVSATFFSAWFIAVLSEEGSLEPTSIWRTAFYWAALPWVPSAVALDVYAGTRGRRGREFGVIGGFVLLSPLLYSVVGPGASHSALAGAGL